MRYLLIIILWLQSLIAISQSPDDPVPGPDHKSRIYIEKLMLEQINAFRKEKGVHPLILDSALAPAALYHVVYQRLAHDMDHWERIDVDDFDEIEGPWTRADHLIDPRAYYSFTENLGSGIISFNVDDSKDYMPDGMYSFQYVADHEIKHGFKTSDAHWRTMMNPKYDRIFIYLNMYFANPNSHGAATVVTIVFAGENKNK